MHAAFDFEHVTVGYNRIPVFRDLPAFTVAEARLTLRRLFANI